MFGAVRIHLDECPHVRLKVVEGIHHVVATRIAHPAPLIACTLPTRIANDSRDVDKSALGDRIGDKILQWVDMFICVSSQK